jgi:hypothetical protein
MQHPVRYGATFGVGLFVVLLLLGLLVPAVWGIRFGFIVSLSAVNGLFQGLGGRRRRLRREAMPDLAGPGRRWGRHPRR